MVDLVPYDVQKQGTILFPSRDYKIEASPNVIFLSGFGFI
jgi:hypothetical protein